MVGKDSCRRWLSQGTSFGMSIRRLELLTVVVVLSIAERMRLAEDDASS